jgi:exonuclease III
MYDNKQVAERNVKVRLDRVVASPSWSAWFPDAKVQHVVTSRYDHFPIFRKAELGTAQGPTSA